MTHVYLLDRNNTFWRKWRPWRLIMSASIAPECQVGAQVNKASTQLRVALDGGSLVAKTGIDKAADWDRWLLDEPIWMDYCHSDPMGLLCVRQSRPSACGNCLSDLRRASVAIAYKRK